MPLINCKVELKLKWTKYCVLASNSTDNIDTDCYKLFYYQRHKKLYVHVVALSAEEHWKLSRLLSKGWERSIYWNEEKMIIKIWEMSIDIFSNETVMELTDSLFLSFHICVSEWIYCL